MSLTVEEIKAIGRETGKKVIVQEKCKERAGFVLELMTDVRDHQVEIMRSMVDPKARRSVISTISSQIDMIKEVYPDSPTKTLLVDELTAIKKRAEQNTSSGTMAFVEQTAQGYVGLHDRLSDVLLEDFKQCECDEPAAAVARRAKPPTEYKEPETIEQGLRDSIVEESTADAWYSKRATHAEAHGDDKTAMLYSRIAGEEVHHWNELESRLKEIQGAVPIMATKKLPTRDEVKVTVWEERDRLHIGIVDKATEQISYADWWDEGAREMFEDGFFSHKGGLENSVLEYAEDMGILAK